MRLLFVFLLLGAGPSLRAGEALESALKRFVDVYSRVEQRIADPFDAADAVYHGAIPGMLRTLDPHSAFLDPDQFESLQEMQRSTEKGFGSIVSLVPGRAILLQTLPGSPSARSGLSPGDEIVVVNGYNLTQMNIEQLVAVLSQSRRRTAELMVMRPGLTRLMTMTLVPAELADPSVTRAFTLRPGVGYLKLANFEQETSREFKKAVEQLGGRELKGLVLDMRGNQGGIVQAAVETASFFLEAGETIHWIQGRVGSKKDVRVPEGFRPYEFPLVILTDDRTASAAELLIGALQDHGRARVVGRNTFGKGLVQSVYSTSQGTALALTTARYLTPSGRSIQRPLGDCRLLEIESCAEEGSDAPSPSSLSAGGAPQFGIIPDREVWPSRYSRLETAMLASNSFLDFAQRYVRGRRPSTPDIGEDFEVTPQILDEFQLFLSQRRIRPGLGEWSSAVAFIRARLKQEIFNLTLGVAKGDEIEIQDDPHVLAALEMLGAR